MPDLKDTTIAILMEQFIAQCPDAMAEVFTSLFNLAMHLGREEFVGAARCQRTPEPRGYVNGFRPRPSPPRGLSFQ